MSALRFRRVEGRLRDQWIGWNAAARQEALPFITNNMRFLILPWVRVPHLASHILAAIAKRVSDDWMYKYGHPIYMLETFVDQERFRGVCYRAANWIRVGQTQGRSRNDTQRLFQVSSQRCVSVSGALR
ncbi:Druantia anti-phage system protein DruA [Paenibacillus naphthalenovorans]|uniref:Druantia anti-phage system protein DruA n=1 Tax=Paenibacillus naphthalenovorans TaxID=162209 RepID=UPI001C319B70|nr:Druantia anti-phage system protein DruA [Paenibacillus naphthalenovorans]